MRNWLAVVAVLIASVFGPTSSAEAGDTPMVCKGEVGNGYNETRPQYKTFGERTFYLTIKCPWGTKLNQWINGTSVYCDYIFQGIQHRRGMLHPDGRFVFNDDHILMAYLEPDGYFWFKMAEAPQGVSVNEGQRWFYGYCSKN